MNEYKVRFYNQTGSLKAEITDFQDLAYRKIVNAPGIMTMGLPGSHLAIPSINLSSHFEVWRKPEGQTWFRDFIGICRKWNWGYKDLPYVQYTAPGILDMLRWRIVAWYASFPNRSMFTTIPTETIANTLVKYNATTYATVLNRRLRDGVISGLSVETDTATGNSIDWYCAYDNLLTSLQKLTKLGPGDFDIVKLTPTTFQWRWYPYQLGTDRSATVVFAMGFGNMAEPDFGLDYIPEGTAAIVGGKGEGDARAIRTRQGTNYDVNYNNTEIFVNATSADTNAALDAEGDAKLKEVETKPTFQFKVLQAPACLYGVHYYLGDLVKGINPFDDHKDKYKVQEVGVEVDKAGQDKIDVVLEWNSVIPV